MDGFINGVLAGVVSAALVASFAYMFRAVIWPIFRRYVDRSPSLNGSMWKGFEVDGTPSDGTLVISQRGNRVRATLNLVRENKPARTFRYSGKIVGLQIVLTWEEEESNGMNVGAYVLRLNPTHDEMVGKTVYVNLAGEGINSSERTYKRVSS